MGESKAPLISPNEFPLIPKMKNEAIPLPSWLRDSIMEAMNRASTDETRYVLNGAFIDAKEPRANYLAELPKRTEALHPKGTLPPPMHAQFRSRLSR